MNIHIIDLTVPKLKPEVATLFDGIRDAYRTKVAQRDENTLELIRIARRKGVAVAMEGHALAKSHDPENFVWDVPAMSDPRFAQLIITQAFAQIPAERWLAMLSYVSMLQGIDWKDDLAEETKIHTLLRIERMQITMEAGALAKQTAKSLTPNG